MLSTLMKDPVKLPHSGVVLDRNTIETFLISNPTDPYHRTPLTKDQLIPMPELKRKIEEYVQMKKNKKNS